MKKTLTKETTKKRQAKKPDAVKSTAKKPVKTTPGKCDQRRADKRQKELVSDIGKERARIGIIIDRIYDKAFSLDAPDMTPLDKHLANMQIAVMAAYEAVLDFLFDYEGVRIRRRCGEYLNKSADKLLEFILGDQKAVEKRICSCNGGCTCHNKDNQLKKITKKPVKKAVK